MRFRLFLLSWSFPLLLTAQTPLKIKVTPLTDRLLVHTTYREYEGKPFPSNGLLVKTDDGVVLIDTGWDVLTDTDQTRQLLAWIDENLHQPVRLCIVTHFHEDRVGGIGLLRKAGIRVVSTPLTAESAARNGYERPEPVLSNDTTLTVGKLPIRCFYPGPGHSGDNIVVWFPTEQVLFGGCFVKSYAAFGLGNLSDANLTEWGNSIRRVQAAFPTPRFVIPGHQEWDQTISLQHTLRLLKLRK
ncbi:subclass B1 metallo-beta-lactamase [Larkinella sp. VNQ87]|uniref:subclass B1 metallo-beta-lactamase n=1 Tax=Larkinella sp. VNQ87 TaxID=3400921 RepID=UPI003C048C01